MTEINSGVKLCLVRVGKAVWEVLAIANPDGESLVDQIKREDPSKRDARRMLALLQKQVPNSGPNFYNNEKCRKIDDEILEFKSGSARVLWFYDPGESRCVICTHIYYKKSRKLPAKELSKAKERRARYFKAKEAKAIEVDGDNVLPFKRR